MGITIVSLVFAFLIRLPALYIALRRAGFWKIDQGALVMLAAFSTLMGFIFPAMGIFDIGGMIFRLILFSIIIMLLLKMDPVDAAGTAVVAAIIQIFMITVLKFSPAAFLVEGISILSVP